MSPRSRRSSDSGRLVIWTVAAVLASSVLAAILYRQRSEAGLRMAVFTSESPAAGNKVFEEKGCSRCHPVNGNHSGIAPDLGRKRKAESSLPQLVTAMWNHAPQMWERMRLNHIPYPNLDERDIARTLSYIYMSRHVQEPGNAEHGKQLFTSLKCIRCHSVNREGGKSGPDLAQSQRFASALALTEAMWNNSTKMQAQMSQMGMAWPDLKGSDLGDVFAYVESVRIKRTASSNELPDPERGWRLFQRKSCMGCHGIKQDEGLPGPTLGPSRELPPTFDQLGRLMIAKAPGMQRVMREQGIAWPELKEREMADIFAFLYSLRYVEPTGSAFVGGSVFKWRGCSHCHGDDASGTHLGPALRGRGRNYNSISLAAQLWEHGAKMYKEHQDLGRSWPTLLESDVGDLLSFLNSPLERAEAAE